jgi:alkanesulfonate monooxygenase SsuD/methylene tetrahydromethanopterin reductase-like flavin-dependent oxidoreductase (luciferase family)
MFTLRFDMRAPESGAPIGELYAAALDMAEWAERNGCLALLVSEHHASPDGYLPAPLLLASALASRTRTTSIQVAALLLPLHDPIELAEQMAVLDVLSGGRVSYVCAVGYRPEEYAMFGRDMAGRGRRMEVCLEALRQAWTGEPFDFEGRAVRVTPKPTTLGGPMLLMGGGDPRVIRRAAKFGMGVIAQGGPAELETIYREACAELGTQPGLFVNPTPDTATSTFVAEDVDRAWDELGPYLLHDARMYDAWLAGASAASGSRATTVDALRAENGNYRILTPDEAIEGVRGGGLLLLQPLCGGLPPQLAWRHLEVLEKRVLPALR